MSNSIEGISAETVKNIGAVARSAIGVANNPIGHDYNSYVGERIIAALLASGEVVLRKDVEELDAGNFFDEISRWGIDVSAEPLRSALNSALTKFTTPKREG